MDAWGALKTPLARAVRFAPTVAAHVASYAAIDIASRRVSRARIRIDLDAASQPPSSAPTEPGSGDPATNPARPLPQRASDRSTDSSAASISASRSPASTFPASPGPVQRPDTGLEVPDPRDESAPAPCLAPVPQLPGGDRAQPHAVRCAHRRLRPSAPAACGGGSSSQIRSPGKTMPSTRRPSGSSARNEFAWPDRDLRSRCRPRRTT